MLFFFSFLITSVPLCLLQNVFLSSVVNTQVQESVRVSMDMAAPVRAWIVVSFMPNGYLSVLYLWTIIRISWNALSRTVSRLDSLLSFIRLLWGNCWLQHWRICTVSSTNTSVWRDIRDGICSAVIVSWESIYECHFRRRVWQSIWNLTIHLFVFQTELTWSVGLVSFVLPIQLS